ncbi:5'-3' exonuclease H3TH domain-containing protein [Paenibacillus sp. CECT 9249]|uniref:5'-3' exonuclease n=1 Tax=unclassified Paenibacillus TaxID=185978 RepID=UPI001C122488|nr:5'-3' exonuclease H3TH domain-containing protein [Paenibacillus sp. CECT 9249]MBU5442788.1 5'-3' exonuclease [Paenibacillus sp. MSJ-34]CAH0117862.1 5'-3' exonuclease [Paenibacillus sp. CECT 9249]
MNETNERRLLLVDGMALLFRAYYATAYGGYIRKTRAGVPTNAVHGFIRYFWDAVGKFKPTHIACCWDMGGRTFRTDKFDDYKANRAEAPDELIPQFSLIKEVMESFGIPNVGIEGYEADDCIGTLARLYAPQMEVLILTGDHDMLQLIDERIRVIIMKKGHGNYMVYGVESLMEEKQLTPRQIVDLKGLMGDTSDNYPGVRGIGEKTALKLIQQFESIEGILSNLDQLSKSVRTKIESDLDMLHLSRDLARIRCDAPVQCDLESCFFNVDHGEIRRKFEELEMESLQKLIEV